jgi:Fic family protein
MTYLHELQDWPHFRWDKIAVSELLAEVVSLRDDHLAHVGSLPHKAQDKLYLDALGREILASFAIEGISLDGVELWKCLAWDLGLPKGEPIASHRLKNIVSVYLDSYYLSETLTAERIQRWQAVLCPNTWTGTCRWRDTDIAVVAGPPDNVKIHYEAPGPERVLGEMAAFLEWFNADATLDPTIKSALTHLYFVTIHPSPDGNGRLARILSDRLLARADQFPIRTYSMSFAVRQRRRKYYAILERVQGGSMDVTDWIRWYLHTLRRAIRSFV